MKNVLGWAAIIGLGILIYNGYSKARKENKILVTKK